MLGVNAERKFVKSLFHLIHDGSKVILILLVNLTQCIKPTNLKLAPLYIGSIMKVSKQVTNISAENFLHFYHKMWNHIPAANTVRSIFRAK